MIERGQQLRLALEARGALGIRNERIGQGLDRDVATKPRVARAIHLAHPARANRLQDLVGAKPRARTERHPVRSGYFTLSRPTCDLRLVTCALRLVPCDCQSSRSTMIGLVLEARRAGR